MNEALPNCKVQTRSGVTSFDFPHEVPLVPDHSPGCDTSVQSPQGDISNVEI